MKSTRIRTMAVLLLIVSAISAALSFVLTPDTVGDGSGQRLFVVGWLVVIAVIGTLGSYFVVQFLPGGRSPVPIGRFMKDAWSLILLLTVISSLRWHDATHFAHISGGFAEGINSPFWIATFMVIARVIHHNWMTRNDHSTHAMART